MAMFFKTSGKWEACICNVESELSKRNIIINPSAKWLCGDMYVGDGVRICDGAVIDQTPTRDNREAV
jgi:hypothetical protein